MEFTTLREDGATYEVHGVLFKRTGSCTRCSGDCCLGCSHYRVINKIPTCTIYTKSNEFCKEHGETHEVCIKFPDHPFLTVIKNGKCAFKFEEIKTSEISKFEELKSKWQ